MSDKWTIILLAGIIVVFVLRKELRMTGNQKVTKRTWDDHDINGPDKN